MSLTNFPRGISSMGVPVIGSGARIPFTTGSYWFVSSDTGSNGNSGKDKDHPFATIDYAIGKCTADKGDVIIVMPGHTETLAAAGAIDVDVAGITIVGVGNGTLIPTITLGTSTSADIDIDAANVTISGLKFTSAIDSLAVVLDVNVGNFTITDCEFNFAATFECLNPINLATTYDNFVIERCKFFQAADPGGTDASAGTGVIYCVDSENILVRDCWFKGYWETAIFHNKTTKAQNVIFEGCVIMLDGPSTATPFELVAATTGVVSHCTGYNASSADVATANLWGAIDAQFWIADSYLGNDSASGDAGAVGATACS
jgi:hypothetical protein